MLQVMTMYANTHTESNATGEKTNQLYNDARKIVHRAVNGGDDDVILFAGSGCTGAISKVW